MHPALNRETVEQVLLGVDAVADVTVSFAPSGDIGAVHLTSDPTRDPGAVARDVRTLLVTRFGADVLQTDISVTVASPGAPGRAEAHGDGVVDPLRWHADGVSGPTARADRVRLQGISLHREAARATATVTVAYGGSEATSSIAGSGSTSSVRRLVADATVAAVDRLLPGVGAFTIRDVDVISIGSVRMTVALVESYRPPAEEQSAGVAIVRLAGELDAAARATLDAVNRQVERYFAEHAVTPPR